MEGGKCAFLQFFFFFKEVLKRSSLRFEICFKIPVRCILLNTYIKWWKDFKTTCFSYPTLTRSYMDLRWVFFSGKDLGKLLNPDLVPVRSITGGDLLVYWIQSASDYVSPFWKSVRDPFETSQIVRFVTSYRKVFQDLAALPIRNYFCLLCFVA